MKRKIKIAITAVVTKSIHVGINKFDIVQIIRRNRTAVMCFACSIGFEDFLFLLHWYQVDQQPSFIVWEEVRISIKSLILLHAKSRIRTIFTRGD